MLFVLPVFLLTLLFVLTYIGKVPCSCTLHNCFLLATSIKEGHHNKWWTASREAYSKRAELTSGLSVGMSLCTYLSIYVCL